MVSSDKRRLLIVHSYANGDIRWKLHLRAKHLVSSHIKDEDIPPLPENKSAIQVLADFMRYLFSCARNYIIESHASGDSMWRSLENNIEFILTHPNGWEGLQQQEIRHAVKIAGLIPGKKQKHAGRIHLLTEGEASLHFCVTNMLASDSLSKFPYVSTDDLEEEEIDESEHQGVVVIDAGGGTIDLSAYSIKLSHPREFKEIAPAECKTCLSDRVLSKTLPHRSSSRVSFRNAKSSYISHGYGLSLFQWITQLTFYQSQTCQLAIRIT